MFVRKLKNRSGSISIQVISKKAGQYKVVKTFGTSKDPEVIELLDRKANYFIHNTDPNQGELFIKKTDADLTVEEFMGTLSNASIQTIGPELIFGTLFDRMGFSQIPDELFRHLVIARLCYPGSKLKTVDYMYRYQGIKQSEQRLLFETIHQF